MRRRRFTTAALTAAVLLVPTACGDDDDTTETSDPTTTVAGSTTAAAETSTTTGETTTTEATTTTVADTTTTAEETTTTSAQPTGIGIEDLTLDGVAIGTATEPAVEALLDRFGAPTADDGWDVGCPLDGDEENERVVQWGGLTAWFTRSTLDDDGVFQAWWYRVAPDGTTEPGGPAPDEFDLPADLEFGDPMSEVEVQLGVPVLIDDVFQIAIASTDAYTLFSDQPDVASPLVTAGVPFVPACE